MALDIALLFWTLLRYAFRIKIFGTSVCLMLMLEVITVFPLDAPQRQMILYLSIVLVDNLEFSEDLTFTMSQLFALLLLYYYYIGFYHRVS
jgi:hypothetical protein